ncbi:MAG: methylenetetrahydrofolate reductase [Ruminococcus sp.]|nr:methylenetetrahydrofolate reductase [NAD(P)H] [Ruminococcus sp.]
MDIAKLFETGKPRFSLEIFPPKTHQGGIETIYETLDGLKDVRPAFISCTYGAGGNRADSSTIEICSIIQERYNIPAISHLTCVNNSKEDIDIILEQLKAKGIYNILALRGDPKPDAPAKEDFAYASDLISYIKQRESEFVISAACYPEGHPSSDDIVSDVINLKKKVDCGAEHLISQLFFDNEDFYRFRERCAIAGIDVPIEAGIMPVTSKQSIMRMVSMCGASIPAKLAKILNRFENDPTALEEACIVYAIDQMVDLITNDVDGIHLYTMNKPYLAKRIFAVIDKMRS